MGGDVELIWSWEIKATSKFIASSSSLSSSSSMVWLFNAEWMVVHMGGKRKKAGVQGRGGEMDQIGSFSSLRARHLFRVRHLSALCGTCCAQALVLAITIILSRYPKWLRIPIARPDFVTCYQTGPQAASYFEWQHEVLISCSWCDCMFLYWILCVCLLVCLIALLVYLVGSFVGYLVGWLGLRSPVCLLVCLFTLYLLHYFVGSGLVFFVVFRCCTIKL